MSRFVALDGPDGSGKSTVARLLVDRLRARGGEVVHLREPGSTTFGERVRAALLDPASGEIDPLAEALAFSAARRAMLTLEVSPALARGADVIVERCFLSTVVYQCRAPLDAAGRAPEDVVRTVTRAVHDGVPHDLIVLLDVVAEVAESRVRAVSAPDRIEARGREFHERVRAGFLDLAAQSSWVGEILAGGAAGGAQRVVVVDAARPIDAVLELVLAAFDGGGAA